MLPISKKELRNSYFGKKEQNKELFKELREKRNSLVKKELFPWKKEQKKEQKKELTQDSPWENTRCEEWRALPPLARSSAMQASNQTIASAAAAHCLSGHSLTCIMRQPQGVSSPAPSTAKQSCSVAPKSTISVVVHLSCHCLFSSASCYTKHCRYSTINQLLPCLDDDCNKN